MWYPQSTHLFHVSLGWWAHLSHASSGFMNDNWSRLSGLMDTNVPRLVWASGLIAPCLFWVHGFYHASSGFMDSTMPLLGSWPITQLSTTSGFVSIGGIVLLPLWVNGCQLSHASWVHGFQIPHASSGSWIWLSTAHHGWQRGGRHIILLWYFFFCPSFVLFSSFGFSSSLISFLSFVSLLSLDNKF